jgi:hypothetical protein
VIPGRDFCLSIIPFSYVSSSFTGFMFLLILFLDFCWLSFFPLFISYHLLHYPIYEYVQICKSAVYLELFLNNPPYIYICLTTSWNLSLKPTVMKRPKKSIFDDVLPESDGDFYSFLCLYLFFTSSVGAMVFILVGVF